MMSSVSRMAQILQNVLVPELGGLLIESVHVQEATRITVIHVQQRHQSTCLHPRLLHGSTLQRREHIASRLISVHAEPEQVERKQIEKRDRKNLESSEQN